MESKNLIDDAYDKAVWILKKCETPAGFFAAYPGYDMVFGRDSMIMSLGASLVPDDSLKAAIRNSISTLAENQSKKGQIPNAVDRFVRSRKHHVDYMSLDSSLWFVVGVYNFFSKYKDRSIIEKYKNHIAKIFFWLSCLDTGEDGMPEQQPTSDWQDAFPHRYGHTINTQALYYHALKLAGMEKEAKRVEKIVNRKGDFALWDNDKGYYLPWRWKNHGQYHEEGEWFDSLGNLLAIIFELADKKQAKRILKFIGDKKVAEPYPMKTIYPAIEKGSKDWQDYFLDCEAGIPWHYANGGIWTFIGGFYVLALIKMGQFKEAKKQLQKLAEANMQNDGNFAEWLHGLTGKIGKTEAGMESYQGWNAAMYIAAYESLKKKRVLI